MLKKWSTLLGWSTPMCSYQLVQSTITLLQNPDPIQNSFLSRRHLTDHQICVSGLSVLTLQIQPLNKSVKLLVRCWTVSAPCCFSPGDVELLLENLEQSSNPLESNLSHYHTLKQMIPSYFILICLLLMCT